MAKKNTAIVYFHGMGEQARYEGVSQLVDALKTYSWNLQPDRAKPLIVTNARLEQSRVPSIESDVTYLETHYHKAGEKPVYHFYEVYWAPLTAGGSSPLAVINWLLSQISAPIRTTFCSPWRFRQRLRIASLYGYWTRKGMKKYETSDLSHLLHAYDNFDVHRARKASPKGSFKEFQKHIPIWLEKSPYGKPASSDDKARIKRLAREWRWAYLKSELMTAIVLFTLLLSVGLGIGGLLYGIIAALRLNNNLDAIPDVSDKNLLSMIDYLSPTAAIVVMIVVLTIFLNYFLQFMSLYMGDVQLWTTYEETNKKFATRKKILQQSTALLMHVLQHPDISRVVLVSHSLGSAIAADTLLEVGRHNRARTGKNQQPLPLHKIDHLITMGSPIDKIHYFFESRGSRSHTYVRTVEGLRGDIGMIPFGRHKTPYIHWINFWDQGDFISGALFTPSNRLQPSLRVDNVHVGSFWFPRPAASHGGYFQHKTVLKHLFDIIFDQQYSFQDMPLMEHNKPDYDSVMLGPGEFQSQTRIFVWLMLSFPWLILLSIIFTVAKVSTSLSNGLYLLSFLNAAILVISWLASKLYGHIDSIEPKKWQFITRYFPRNTQHRER